VPQVKKRIAGKPTLNSKKTREAKLLMASSAALGRASVRKWCIYSNSVLLRTNVRAALMEAYRVVRAALCRFFDAGGATKLADG